MSLKFLPLVALLASWPQAAFAADDIPKRQSGLWVFDSPDNRLVKGSLCVDDTDTNFIETDIWSNFVQECVVSNSVGNLRSWKIKAHCQSPMTDKVELSVTFDGDFTSRYRFVSVSVFEGMGGKDDQLISTVEAVYQGRCPDNMKPGTRTPGR
ncbi:hypothetical protein GGE43_004056 [Agrobacterium tumefaciens]|jgi:hypothetical protein|uniref:DUF3617 family protein n=1 Tax=Agrobacterium radiobacter TaxID=362 RepID=A0ABR6JCK5_AGRRD|nr:hypothetical protein [Agrobacterium radiobacter]MBB4320491.1 hypothetical protein [Agrobacterium radiobacter]MBB4337156.1 hypothetical protein [Agrobacterium radiobacter]MBB4492596.1 hypothetical protein [Agrobacterium radiobacter]MBB4497494.1 hypothetical protein [Agrobacterium radiobacter]MBB4502595.1 hypothetical protein [Agrobacterium radiobacter]